MPLFELSVKSAEECNVPPSEVEGSTKVSIHSSSGDVLSGSLSFLYAEAPIVTGVSPARASTAGAFSKPCQ